MNDGWGLFFGIIAAVAVVAGIVALEVSVWNECRDFGRSWFYCFRQIGGR